MAAIIPVSGNAAVVTLPSATVATTAAQVRETYSDAPVKAVSNREVQPAVLDSVTLLNNDRKAENRPVRKSIEKDVGKQGGASRGAADILFAYNFRGDLRIKFMDSGNKMVYQTPALLFSRMTDIMMLPSTSVDTQV